MKKLVIRSVFFLLVAAASYTVLLVGWVHLVPFGFLKKNLVYPLGGKGFTFTRLAEVDSVANVDVLFLGSSHSYRGFDPRIFASSGLRTFNLGSPSQTPLQTRILLEKYLEKLNPKLVVYEVYPATFQNDGLESALDLIANSDCSSCSFELTKSTENVKAYNALIYDVVASVFGFNKGFQEPVIKGNDQYVLGGYVESEETLNESPVTDKMRRNWVNDKWEFRDSQWEEFLSVLAMLKERNIAVELIQMPVTLPAFQLYKNNTQIDSLFESQGSYLNLNGVSVLDDNSDFIDYHHLSQTGVENVNKTLLELILPKYFQNP